MLSRSVAALAVAALAVLAASGGARADPGTVYAAVRDHVDNPERSQSAVSHMEKLLSEIEDRVEAESKNTGLEWRVTEAQYVHDIEHINNTLVVVTYNRTQMDQELVNMTARLNVLGADLSSLDGRIGVRQKRIDEIAVLLSDGTAFDLKREIRFQDRTAFAKKTVEGVDNVIDALGSNSVDEVDGSLRQALNTLGDVYEEPAPVAAEANKTAGSFLEAGAQVRDDLDELRLLLGQMHAEMHKYMDDMATVRVKQSGDWAHVAGNLQEESRRLKKEIEALENTRIPNRAAVADLKERFATTSLNRIAVNRAVEATRSRLDKKVQGLAMLRAEHKSEQSAREGQLRTVERLQRELELHDGDVPAHVRAAAKRVGTAGSAEEQRLKRVKAALSAPLQTSGTPQGGKGKNATGDAKAKEPEAAKPEPAVARPRS